MTSYGRATSSTILAIAIELARLHGVKFAASYLFEAGVDIGVAVEGLCMPSGISSAAERVKPNVKHFTSTV